jgi:hypothetical protein
MPAGNAILFFISHSKTYLQLHQILDSVDMLINGERIEWASLEIHHEKAGDVKTRAPSYVSQLPQAC